MIQLARVPVGPVQALACLTSKPLPFSLLQAGSTGQHCLVNIANEIKSNSFIIIITIALFGYYF